MPLVCTGLGRGCQAGRDGPDSAQGCPELLPAQQPECANVTTANQRLKTNLRNSFSTQFSLLDDAEGPKSTENSEQAIKHHSSGSRGLEGKCCDASS